MDEICVLNSKPLSILIHPNGLFECDRILGLHCNIFIYIYMFESHSALFKRPVSLSKSAVTFKSITVISNHMNTKVIRNPSARVNLVSVNVHIRDLNRCGNS